MELWTVRILCPNHTVWCAPHSRRAPGSDGQHGQPEHLIEEIRRQDTALS